MAKTKIIATLGPATETPDQVEALARAGAEIFRINFSHVTPEKARVLAGSVREASRRVQRPLALLGDLQGPKVRVAALSQTPLFLAEGESVEVRGDRAPEGKGFQVDYPEIHRDIHEGALLLIDDGAIRLRVVAVEGPRILARVEVGGTLLPRKGVNAPGAFLDLPVLSEKDRRDLEVAAELGFPFIAVSFVRKGEDMAQVRAALPQGYAPWLISKIETQAALDHLEEILAQSDGVMVARGDLGVEVSLEQVPFAQKRILRLAREFGIFSITATQILESMIEHPSPTRAEISDIANAILDGTDALMLSEETAVGRHPLQAVQVLERVARATEETLAPFRTVKFRDAVVPEAIAHAAARIAVELNASTIIAFTETGSTPRFVSRLRPRIPVLAITPYRLTAEKVQILFGVQAHRLDEKVEGADGIFRVAEETARALGLAGPGDRIVIVGGVPTGRPGGTNLVKVSTL